MDSTIVSHKRKMRSTTKVKTGCTTCRIRRVKCDEEKPCCQKCVSTGRKCDGYMSPFRSQYIKNAPIGSAESGVDLRVVPSTLPGSSPLDVRLLNQYFSTKTMLDVHLACGEEAKQVLQASLTHLPVHHAVLSLKALRDDLESSRDILVPRSAFTSGYNYGLQQYNMALRGLASDLSAPGYDTLKSALLCCQTFISIEQTRSDYAAMAQHIVRGLSIMRENRARPGFVAVNQLAQARYDRLPFIDVFAIKLFVAPCRHSVPPTVAIITGNTLSAEKTSLPSQSPNSEDRRMIAPNMRVGLKNIAKSALVFLDKAAQVESVDHAYQLLSEKAVLLDALESWLLDLELLPTSVNSPGGEPLAIFFMRFLHQLLKMVLMGALDLSPDLKEKLQIESERFQSVADQVNEKLRVYGICN